MRSITFFIVVLAMAYPAHLNAQTRIEPDPGKWNAYNCEATFTNDTIHLINTTIKDTLNSMNTSQKSAILWLNNINFKNGIIELEIKGKDVRGQSFVGIAFHALDNDHYDAVYFRPFNFRNPERKAHAIQYIDRPDNTWNVLRKQYPGKYENSIHPVPDPDGWFHAKIVINSPEIRLYINNSRESTFNVRKISERTGGKLGLWIDGRDGWFRNITITQTN